MARRSQTSARDIAEMPKADLDKLYTTLGNRQAERSGEPRNSGSSIDRFLDTVDRLPGKRPTGIIVGSSRR